MKTFFIVFFIFNLYSINRIQASLIPFTTKSHNHDNEQMQPTNVRGELINEPSESKTFEKILNDLKLSKNNFNDESKIISSIGSKLHSSYISRNIFKQNCKSYNPLILIKLLSFDHLPVE